MLPADTRLPLVVSVSENTDPAEERRKKVKEESHSVILRFILGCCHPLIHFHQWQDCSCNGRQRKRLNFATKNLTFGFLLLSEIGKLYMRICLRRRQRYFCSMCFSTLIFSSVLVQPHICFRAYKDLFGRYSNTDLAESVISAG